MNYLDSLEVELAAAGIPARRARGSWPSSVTTCMRTPTPRWARRAIWLASSPMSLDPARARYAYRGFAALAIAALCGSSRHRLPSRQVDLPYCVPGGCGVCRWPRLRTQAILNRRAVVGLVSGAITMTVLPLTHFVVELSATGTPRPSRCRRSQLRCTGSARTQRRDGERHRTRDRRASSRLQTCACRLAGSLVQESMSERVTPCGTGRDCEDCA